MARDVPALALDAISLVRANHSLEHATVAILLSKLGPQLRVIGRATNNGFYFYGNLPLEEVHAAAEEALQRLQAGESELAVSPFCGTNYATAGLLSGLGAVLASAGRGSVFLRLPNALFASLVGVMVGFALGRLVQKYLTTSPDLSGLRIVRIEKQRQFPPTIFVETVWETPWRASPAEPSPA